MKVILLADVKGQGKKDDVVTVSDGYARNFLLPKKLAVEAGAAALNDIKNREAAKQHKIEADRAAARETAARLESVTVKIHGQSGGDGKLYGSVTSAHIADALKEQTGIEVDRRKIVMDGAIKTFGTYQLSVKLYPEVSGTINLIVAD